MTDLTSKQLQRAAKIQAKIERLQSELSTLLSNPSSPSAPPKKRKMSAAARAKISAAQKARWAKAKGKK